MKKLFIDTETTGLDPEKSGLYQIAGIIEIESEEHLLITEEFDLFCNIFDNDVVLEESLEKNNMTIEMIRTFNNPRDVYKEFTGILSKHVNKFNQADKFLVIGYFSDFDNQVLRSWFTKNDDKYFGSWFWHPWLDVSQIVTYFCQDYRLVFPNFKLETVADLLEVKEDKNGDFHNALYDVKVTRSIYHKFDDILKTYWEEV